jgi:hypothetical protein
MVLLGVRPLIPCIVGIQGEFVDWFHCGATPIIKYLGAASTLSTRGGKCYKVFCYPSGFVLLDLKYATMKNLLTLQRVNGLLL